MGVGKSIYSRMSGRAPENLHKLAIAIAVGLVAGYAGGVIKENIHHDLLLDAQGHPALSDFVSFWTAGQRVLHGAALATYDAHLEHAAEAHAVGHAFHSTLGWSYPPLLFFVVAGLASLPYALSFLVWTCTTLAAHVISIAAIAKRNLAVLFAGAAPWVLTCFMSGQNGFFTAFLLGAALLLIEEQAAFAGLCFGMLSYKPQLGILVPLVLAAAGYWRVFAYAAAATLSLNALAGIVFGFATFGGFLHAISGAAGSHLTFAGLGWNKLESVYGFVRALGGNATSAWIAQIALAAAVALFLVVLWRSRAPFALKAAALAVGVPLATPYVLVYDLPVLSVAVAFLFRHGEFDRLEVALVSAILPCVLLVLLLPFPSALFASVAVAAIVLRRASRVVWHRQETGPIGQAGEISALAG